MANTTKTAIVTGASRGIGAGLVEAFLKQGIVGLSPGLPRPAAFLVDHVPSLLPTPARVSRLVCIFVISDALTAVQCPGAGPYLLPEFPLASAGGVRVGCFRDLFSLCERDSQVRGLQATCLKAFIKRDCGAADSDAEALFRFERNKIAGAYS